jgi:uncharacterized protein YodC (DUF2158 family)
MQWGKLKQKLFGCTSKFTVGDSVQQECGSDDLMIVTEIFTSRQLSEPLIGCKWSVRGRTETRTSLFPESKLKRFDWNKAF